MCLALRAAWKAAQNGYPAVLLQHCSTYANQARLEDGRLIRWYTDAIFKGHRPADILDYLGADAPLIQSGDAEMIAQRCDFRGINYCHPTESSSSNPAAPQLAVRG